MIGQTPVGLISVRRLSQMKTIATLDLYRHAHEPKFILVRHAPDKQLSGISFPWGELVHLSDEQIRVRGIEIVMADFLEFASRDCDAEAVWSNPAARKKAQRILRDYFSVSVGLLEQPILDIWSWHETARGRRVTLPEDHFQLAVPCAPETFYATISEALERCVVLT
jgi:hypothetical protein